MTLHNSTQLDAERMADFNRLMGLRLRWSISLSLYVLAVFGLYLCGMAFARDLMATQVGNTTVNVGILVAVFVVVNGVATSGLYTWWTNTYLEPRKRLLVDHLTH